jgi:acetyl-CoA hydrolase
MSDVDLARWIRPGDTVVWGQANAEPLGLIEALVAQRHDLARLRLFLGIGGSGRLRPEHADAFDFLAYCGSGTNRALAQAGVLDILPTHYSQLPGLIRSGALRIDVVMLQVSPADEQGRHSLGLAHEYLVAALDTARVVVAEVHEQVPWTHGERLLRADEIDLRIDAAYPLPQSPTPAASGVEEAIADRVAGLVEDGATLQFGIGALPRAVLARLADRRDLGVHSGVIHDGVADFVAAGIVTNARKSIDRGVTVTGLLMGSERLHRWAHRNPSLALRGSDYTHDAAVLASIDRFVAINSAIEVDLGGQINAETAGGVYVGAVGGALDFLRGAQRSRGGVPIVALPSTARGRSRIVARLDGPVTTPRSDAGVVVTEHGIADLRGLSLRQRRQRLLDIADPEQRERLEGEPTPT